MKKNLLSLFSACVMTSVGLVAQPTLTSSGISATIGEVLSIANSTVTASPGNSGANQTWNLSSLTGTASSNTVVSVSSTPNGASFPNANIALQGSGYYAYYKTSSTAWQNYGSSSSVVMAYSNPEDFMHFPFTYNNTYTDTWATTFTNTYTFYRTGSTTVTADGYGTVTTPAGTFTNALRVHFVQNYQDSAYIGVPYIITYQNDEYMWYVNGNHLPLATVYTLTSNGSPSSGGSYMTNAVNGISSHDATINSCKLFPNPATDQASLSLDLNEARLVQVELFNALGTNVGPVIKEVGSAGHNNIPINLGNLPEGIYFAQVYLDGKLTETRRFIVAR